MDRLLIALSEQTQFFVAVALWAYGLWTDTSSVTVKLTYLSRLSFSQSSDGVFVFESKTDRASQRHKDSWRSCQCSLWAKFMRQIIPFARRQRVDSLPSGVIKIFMHWRARRDGQRSPAVARIADRKWMKRRWGNTCPSEFSFTIERGWTSGGSKGGGRTWAAPPSPWAPVLCISKHFMCPAKLLIHKFVYQKNDYSYCHQMLYFKAQMLKALICK